MLPSEKVAIAAHLHVLLRRKTGRVTDTEWMATNAEYAHEIVRFARARAQEDGHADLAEWADKLPWPYCPQPRQRPQQHPAPSPAWASFATRHPHRPLRSRPKTPNFRRKSLAICCAT